MCGRVLLGLFSVSLVIAAVLHALYVSPLLSLAGRSRVLTTTLPGKCQKHKDLQACKKIILHEPSGLVYAACSQPYLRTLWQPGQTLLNSTGAGKDYLAVFNPDDGSSKHLPLVRFSGGLSLMGFDVVSTTEDPRQVFLYAINIRPSIFNNYAKGPDAVVEIFKSDQHGFKLSHVNTIKDPLIGLPNDIIGSPDGKSFFITNDIKNKGIWARFFDVVLRRDNTFVTYCDVAEGCRIVARRLVTASGIARGQSGEIYVANTFSSAISVFEEQADHSLVLTDTIPINAGALDGLSVDTDGSIYAAELPKVFTWKFQHLKDPKHLVPSSALKITLNTDESSYYGQKYKIEKVLEDAGKTASGMTSVVHDKTRGKIYLHGEHTFSQMLSYRSGSDPNRSCRAVSDSV
ncbi:calcium-dependent phosphotriesterase [Auriculariales sp. MPI-PUGE-AT-0066]|nr:calcium-dependent phosphotriesterase [Auriculariales sp. MPI-PUGE-AT-0066]